MVTTTKYLWDDETDTVVQEKDDSDVTHAFYRADPVPYGRLFSMRRGNSTYNYRYDAQGNTRALTDETGHITDTYRYDAWGEQTERSGPTNNPYRYIGQYGYQFSDATTDYYIRERLYQPKRGRWKSTDPLRFVDGLNQYVYAINSPIEHLDPSGLVNLLCPCKVSAWYEWASGWPVIKYVKTTCVGKLSTTCCKEACKELTHLGLHIYVWNGQLPSRLNRVGPKWVNVPLDPNAPNNCPVPRRPLDPALHKPGTAAGCAVFKQLCDIGVIFGCNAYWFCRTAGESFQIRCTRACIQSNLPDPNALQKGNACASLVNAGFTCACLYYREKACIDACGARRLLPWAGKPSLPLFKLACRRELNLYPPAAIGATIPEVEPIKCPGAKCKLR